MKKLDVND